MASTYAIAFSAAVAIALVTLPVMRRVAIASELVNRPRAGRFSTREVPYLGGIALAIAFLAGLLVGPGHTSTRVGIVVLAAIGLALVGLIDDSSSLAALPRVLAQIGAACAMVAIDVRVEVTGIAAVDVAITILWIVGITNAFNLLDNMDGLAAAVAAASAGGVFGLAALGGQEIVGTVAVALAGGCIGFLAFNLRPASLYLGDAGSMLIGFLLGVLTLDLRPPVAQPESLLVPLLLVGLAILDTSIVTIGRLRHRRRIASGSTDHLSHRLVALGLRTNDAVATIVTAQLAFSAIAVFVGRGVLGIGWSLLFAGAIAGGLIVAAARAGGRVYGSPPRRIPTRVLLVVAGAILVVVVLALPAAVVGWSARADATAGRDAVDRAVDAARRGDIDVAEREFAQAESAFRSASRRLSNPFASAGLIVPVVGPNLRTTRELASLGQDLSEAGVRLAARHDSERFGIAGGLVPLEEIHRVTPDLAEAVTILDDATVRLNSFDRTHLLPPVTEALEELAERIEDAHHDAITAHTGAVLAGDIFGGNGERRYFLAVQNSAELRATGGFIGNWGTLLARDGHVELEEFDRISVLNPGPDEERLLEPPDDLREIAERFDVARTWQNVNMSPDLPTVSRAIVDLFPQAGQPPVDGVVAVDSQGLAALLEITGPVDVEPWPEPITPDNVVDVTLRDAYVVLEGDARVEFLGDVARTVWEAVTERDLGTPDRIGAALAAASREGHLAVYLENELEERLVHRVGASGAVPPVAGDSLLVVDQNAAGNKADYYLRRRVVYSAILSPDDDLTRTDVDATLAVTLENGAPEGGLPEIVIGPFDDRYEPGENRTHFTLYTPLEFTRATLDGQPTAMRLARELGRNAFWRLVSLPSSTERTMTFELVGSVPLDEGWYELDLLRQPVLTPDRVLVEITAAPGWRIAEVEELDLLSRSARRELDLAEPTTMRVRLERQGPSLWDRLQAG